MVIGPDISTDQLQTMVREHLQQGRLPVIVNPYVKAGYGGVGLNCQACGHEIEQHHAEYEVPNANGQPLFFHIRCHHAWQAECARLQSRNDEVASSKPDGSAERAGPASAYDLRLLR